MQELVTEPANILNCGKEIERNGNSPGIGRRKMMLTTLQLHPSTVRGISRVNTAVAACTWPRAPVLSRAFCKGISWPCPIVFAVPYSRNVVLFS